MDDRITLDDIEHMCEADSMPILACMVDGELWVVCFQVDSLTIKEKLSRYIPCTVLSNYIEVPKKSYNSKRELIVYMVIQHIQRGKRNLFEDDITAKDLLDGRMENLNKKELLELTGLNNKEYETKWKKIRRRINKLYLGG